MSREDFSLLAVGGDLFRNAPAKKGPITLRDTTSGTPPYAGSSGWPGLNTAVEPSSRPSSPSDDPGGDHDRMDGVVRKGGYPVRNPMRKAEKALLAVLVALTVQSVPAAPPASAGERLR